MCAERCVEAACIVKKKSHNEEGYELRNGCGNNEHGSPEALELDVLFVDQERKDDTEDEVCEGAAEELLGECHQQ